MKDRKIVNTFGKIFPEYHCENQQLVWIFEPQCIYISWNETFIRK